MKEPHVKRNYKDSLFRMLFKEKENLLSLYIALNRTIFITELTNSLSSKL